MSSTWLTYAAMRKFFAAANDLGATRLGVFDHAQAGLFFALVGFVVAGGVMSPRVLT